MYDLSVFGLYRQIGPMADHDATGLGGGVELVLDNRQRIFRAVREMLAAALLDGLDALDLTFGKPPSGHGPRA
jgi:hypothetical protein